MVLNNLPENNTVAFAPSANSRSRYMLVLFACVCLFLLGRFFIADYDERICRAYDSTSEYVASLVFDKTEYNGDVYHNLYARALIPTSLAYWFPGLISHYFGISLHFLSMLLFLAEPFLVILSAYLVTYYLTRRPWIALTAGILAYCGEAGYWNLAGFGYEKKYPYPPYLAYGCSFISIWYFLKEGPKRSAVWQILASLIHPAIGIHLAGVLGVGVLYSRCMNKYSSWQPHFIASILSGVIALTAASLASVNISGDYRASAAVVYSAMNEGHGAIWENAQTAISASILGYGFYAVVFFICCRYLLRTSNTIDPRFLWLLLGSVAVSMLGLLAKVLCQFAVHTSWGNLLLPLHQLLFLRASHFTLVLMLMICVWALLDIMMRTTNVLTIITSGLILFRMALPWSFHVNYADLQLHLNITLLMLGALALSDMLWPNIKEGVTIGRRFLDFLRYHIASILVSLSVSYYVLFGWSNEWVHSRRLMLLTGIVLLLCGADWLANTKYLSRARPAINVLMLLTTLSFWVYAWTTNASLIFVIMGGLLTMLVFLVRYLGDIGRGSSAEKGVLAIGLSVIVSLVSVVNVTTLYSFDTRENREWLTISEWAKSKTTPGTSFLFLEAGDLQTQLPYGWRARASRGRIQLFDDVLGLYYYPDLRLNKQSEERRRYLIGRFPTKGKREIIESMSREDWRWMQWQTQASMAIARKGLTVNLPEVFRVDSFVVYRMSAL